AEEAAGALGDGADGAGGHGDGVAQVEVGGGRCQRQAVQRQRAEADDFAGLVHRLVGRQVRQGDRGGQLPLAQEGGGPGGGGAALLAGGHLHGERLAGPQRHRRRDADAVQARPGGGDAQLVARRLREGGAAGAPAGGLAALRPGGGFREVGGQGRLRRGDEAG